MNHKIYERCEKIKMMLYGIIFLKTLFILLVPFVVKSNILKNQNIG